MTDLRPMIFSVMPRSVLVRLWREGFWGIGMRFRVAESGAVQGLQFIFHRHRPHIECGEMRLWRRLHRVFMRDVRFVTPTAGVVEVDISLEDMPRSTAPIKLKKAPYVYNILDEMFRGSDILDIEYKFRNPIEP